MREELALFPSLTPLPLIEDWEVLDLLSSLVDKSLVGMEERSGKVRYRMMETIRQYARECGDAEVGMHSLQRRHLDYFLPLAWETWKMPVRIGNQVIADDYGNLMAALEFSLANPQGAWEAMRLAGALQRFWEVQGHLTEGRRFCRLVSEHPGAERLSEESVRTLRNRANWARLACDYEEADTLYKEMIALARELLLPVQEAGALSGLSNLRLLQGDYPAAHALCEQALTLIRREHQNEMESHLLLGMARILCHQGELEEALQHCKQAIRMGKEAGNQRAEYEGINRLGLIHMECRDYALAESCFSEALRLYEEIGSPGGMAAVRCNLGEVARKRGEREKALDYYRQALQLNLEIGYPIGILDDLQGIAQITPSFIAPENAVRLLGWMAHTRARLRLVNEGTEQGATLEDLTCLLGKARAETLYAQGTQLTLQEAAHIGLEA